MTYKINILPNAEDGLKWFRQHSKQDYLKCFDLVRAIATDPRDGIGKPKRLKHCNCLLVKPIFTAEAQSTQRKTSK